VVEAMLPYLSGQFGNASSRHEYGRAARRAIDEARSKVAAAVGAHASEVVFTSGGSEANNLLIKGAAACLKPGLLAVSAIEHPCVIKPAEQFRKRGWTLTNWRWTPPDGSMLQASQAVIGEQPRIVSVMLANNETGVVQDVESLATQAMAAGPGFIPMRCRRWARWPSIFVAQRRRRQCPHLSAHKIGGPKGAAALVLDKRLDIEPLIAGGGHERGLRSGTENVAAIVGFGVACELAASAPGGRGAAAAGPARAGSKPAFRLGATLFGQAAERLPNTFISRFPTSMARHWLATSTAPVTRWPAARPVRAPTRNPRMCCGRWASKPNWHVARCGSAWVRPTAQPGRWLSGVRCRPPSQAAAADRDGRLSRKPQRTAEPTPRTMSQESHVTRNLYNIGARAMLKLPIYLDYSATTPSIRASRTR
jgi:cysteine desulfurase